MKPVMTVRDDAERKMKVVMVCSVEGGEAELCYW